MSGEATLLDEFFPTLLTFIVSFTSVHLNVFGEITLLDEFLPTLLTFIVSFSSVHLGVCSESIL